MLIQRTSTDVDIAARNLAALGRLGRSMPPSWDGAQLTIPVMSPDGGYMGKLLPGKGFRFAMDARQLGIKRELPYVFNDSLTRRLWDTIEDERGAITTYDLLLAARDAITMGPKAVAITKTDAQGMTNLWSSLFLAPGTPTPGSYTNIPGGTTCNNNTTGSFLNGLANPTAPDRIYILSYLGGRFQVGGLIIADLLLAAGGIDSNSASTQAVNSSPLTRYTTGAGVMMTFENYQGTIGTTASNLTVTKYTNQAGATLRATAGQAMTTGARIYALEPQTLGPFVTLQAGDYGVRSVEEVQLSVAMGVAARNLALHLYFPLSVMPAYSGDLSIEKIMPKTLEVGIKVAAEADNTPGCITFYPLSTSQAGVFSGLLMTAVGS